ncbi:DNA-binding MurR/RpiR family transcriptional regulator [Agromyces sp. 3263]|uniref:MurR/RpiR family transcriptional regulator n=1 Tax=Agromyces sp. 3263 TaxID=2817750 RepID=UPI0028622979|nr:MurR/RpiR family transcriptional regulator [Agromyces sp. 3263]MDR6907855.1 DNA-binding MurR/RpiR family transcriptional regulator [Agromyces sp. 3263]
MASEPAPVTSVAEAIRSRMGELSPAERKVGRALLNGYPSAGFETVARLASRAGVSGPTVVRFATRLGYRGFPEFQQALRDDLDQRSASPLAIYDRGVEHPSPAEPADPAAIAVSSVERTFATVPPHDIEACAEALADPRAQIRLAGGRYSQLLARFLELHLRSMRPGAAMLPDETSSRAAEMGTLTRRDVLVLFDFRRYEEPTRALAEFAAAKRTRVVLFTDTWMSPIASVATVVLPSATDSSSPFDAMTPAMALVEAVIASCFERLGESATERMRHTERDAHALGLV